MRDPGIATISGAETVARSLWTSPGSTARTADPQTTRASRSSSAASAPTARRGSTRMSSVVCSPPTSPSVGIGASAPISTGVTICALRRSSPATAASTSSSSCSRATITLPHSSTSRPARAERQPTLAGGESVVEARRRRPSRRRSRGRSSARSPPPPGRRARARRPLQSACDRPAVRVREPHDARASITHRSAVDRLSNGHRC